MNNQFLINEEQLKTHILNSSSPTSTPNGSNVEERLVFQSHRVCITKPVELHPGNGDQGPATSPSHSYFQSNMNMYRSSPRSSRTSIQIDAMTRDELQKIFVQIVQERDKLKEEIKNYSTENINLRQQLESRRIPHNLNQHFSPSRCSQGQTPVNERRILCSTQGLSPYSYEIRGKDTETSEEDEDEDGCSEDDALRLLLPDDLRTAEHQSQSRISVIFSQSMTVLANINNEQVIEKVCAGSQVAKQLIVGNCSGYLACYLMRRFGKIAAGSIVGSVCLLKLAHHRGYIAVDWSRIQKQMDGSAISSGMIDDSGVSVEDDLAWVTHKIQRVREWSHENSYTVLGFCTGFFFYNLHR